MRISDWSSDVCSSDLVVGDVDPQRVRALAEKYYGVIPTKDIPERQRVAAPPQNASREVRLVSPRVAQPQVSISYLAPSSRQATGNEAYALQVASERIGGGAPARLYSRMVVEQGSTAERRVGTEGVGPCRHRWVPAP